MKTPSYEVQAKVFKIRCQTKRDGSSYDHEKFKYCAKVQKQYPEWYSSITEQVRLDTLPIGAK